MMTMMTSGARAKVETMRRAMAEKNWHRHNRQTRANYAAETARRALANRQCHKDFEQSFAKVRAETNRVRAETNRRAKADNDWHGHYE